jgi:acyl carrier protein
MLAAMHEEAVRTILAEHCKLSVDVSSLRDDSDLYNAGLTSLTTVNVMLAIEDHFDIEFEDSMLSRATFQSVETLVEAVEVMLDE